MVNGSRCLVLIHTAARSRERNVRRHVVNDPLGNRTLVPCSNRCRISGIEGIILEGAGGRGPARRVGCDPNRGIAAGPRNAILDLNFRGRDNVVVVVVVDYNDFFIWWGRSGSGFAFAFRGG